MADKMMRIAGRGKDGTAKALRTDNEGRLSTGENIVLLGSQLNLSVEPGENKLTTIKKIDLEAYSSIFISIKASAFNSFESSIQFTTKYEAGNGVALSPVFNVIKARNKNMASSKAINLTSDQLEAVYIKNNMTSSTLQYDVRVYGVKGVVSRADNNPIDLSSVKYTEQALSVRGYTGDSLTNTMGIFVESGSVRVQSNGEDATADTGIPLGHGHYMFWNTDFLSVYSETNSTITVVNRQ